MKGFLYNIQRFSIYDGPGIRTTVFVKGCNLKCKWCHNPESIKSHQEIQYYEQKCVQCGRCVEVCPTHAIYYDSNNSKKFDRSKCNYCGLCIQNCLYGALIFVGKYMEPDEVVDIIKKDIDYYKNSHGGLTISGGEPMLQKDFVKEIFDKTHKLGIHNALDTAAYVSLESFEDVLPFTDLVLLDLKVMNSEIHRKNVGVDNTLILENAIKLSKADVDIIVRIPVIKDINDSSDNMCKTAEFLSVFNRLLYVELLPYHDLGSDKYRTLGYELEETNYEPPTRERMKELAECFFKHNIDVKFQ